MQKDFPTKPGYPARSRKQREEPTFLSRLLARLGLYQLVAWTGKKFGLSPAWSNKWIDPFVLIFGFVFFLVGSSMLLRIPYLFYLKGRLNDAIEVPAKILNVELVSSGGRGRSSSLILEYEYTIHGRVIRGNRPSIFEASSELYDHLRDAQESGRTVTCLVDRNDPEFSAFEKDVRIMDLICGIIGVTFSFMGGFYLILYHGAIQRSTRHHLR